MKKLLMLVVLLCGIQNAGAAFIDSGTYLTDTTSGLDWLDVTASVNRSYNDVSSQFGVGGDFAGWRYATGLEFNGLVANWTGMLVFGTGYTIYPDVGVGSIDGLVVKLGSTWDTGRGFDDGAKYDYTYGITADVWSTSAMWLAIIVNDDRDVATSDVSNAHFASFDVPYVNPFIGSFLVRSKLQGTTGDGHTIPEPTTIALFGLGLAGFCFSRRKVKAKSLS